jgi:hypothetical protein
MVVGLLIILLMSVQLLVECVSFFKFSVEDFLETHADNIERVIVLDGIRAVNQSSSLG